MTTSCNKLQQAKGTSSNNVIPKKSAHEKKVYEENVTSAWSLFHSGESAKREKNHGTGGVSLSSGKGFAEKDVFPKTRKQPRLSDEKLSSSGPFMPTQVPLTGTRKKVENKYLEAFYLMPDDQKVSYIFELNQWNKHNVPTKVTHQVLKERKEAADKNSEEFSDKLKDIVACDQICVYYNTTLTRMEPASGEQPDELPIWATGFILWCVWFDDQGVIHEEFLPGNKGMTTKGFIGQFAAFSKKWLKKRKEKGVPIVIIDKLPAHEGWMRVKDLADFKVKCTHRSSHFSDTNPCDYGLAYPVCRYIRENVSKDGLTREGLENLVSDFLMTCGSTFFSNIIGRLPQIWKKIGSTGGCTFY